ncbi:glycosyltransferase [Slackia isoflavoniconvertens]|nr:glycosyltransferase [Slackia isoflavoniconvertens]
MGRFSALKENAAYVYKEEGLAVFAERMAFHIKRRLQRPANAIPFEDYATDVLYINGCAYSVPQPIRYRVDHQVEQLRAHGISARRIDAWNLNKDCVRTARVFIIFRCPYSDAIGDFIQLAKSLNKVVLFDIDDLVIDRFYTDQIPFLDTLSPEDRKGYDDGVDAMQKTMMLCDGVVTTTDALANELLKYHKNVCINRNVASDEMVYFSERAIQERDLFPLQSRDEVNRKDLKRWKNAKQRSESRDKTQVHIGYFSGSITHNDDFEAIVSPIKRIFESYPNVRLHVVGELTVPDGLKGYEDRIVAVPFMPWRRLPKLISEMDINIAPLVDSIFNRAKSENKWLEASLVKVPTIASNVGAFRDAIKSGEDGFLCDSEDDWFNALSLLIENEPLRKQVGHAAYEVCINSKTTLSSGFRFAQYIRSQFRENIAFAMPSLDISGGNLVTFKHAIIMKKHGYDITIIDGYGEDRWYSSEGEEIPVLNRNVLPENIDGCPIDMSFDKAVGTFWETQQFIERYRKIDKRFYLVQGQEQGFYQPCDENRIKIGGTYSCKNVTVLTISKWCDAWLRGRFGVEARLARNGLNLDSFHVCGRDYSGKIRVLIEGDSSVAHKNVDESFKIANRLNREKFEVWYLSYKGEPKDFYRYDKYLHAVPHEEVGAIYEQCHILLKTSILESFSYPPLEMMATGGIPVVLENPGNREYLVDGENCLLFSEGEDDKAVDCINRIVNDEALRNRLIQGALNTAKSRDWAMLEDEIARLYE